MGGSGATLPLGGGEAAADCMWPLDLSKALTLEVADLRALERVEVTVLAVRTLLVPSLVVEELSEEADLESRSPLMLLDNSRQALEMEDMTGLLLLLLLLLQVVVGVVVLVLLLLLLLEPPLLLVTVGGLGEVGGRLVWAT